VESRPLHAVLLPPGGPAGPLLERLPAALDGTGPAILPLDGGLPRARLAALLAALRPSAVETTRPAERYAPSWPGGQAGPGVPPDIAVVVVTSGSTGEPKGVQLSAAALRASARASLDRIGAAAGARWLACLPAFHVAGLQVLVRSLVAGTEPVSCPVLSPDVIAAHRGAYLSLVPTQLRRLTEARADLSGIPAILLGGAAIPPGLIAAAADAGARVITTYGMTETCGGCVYDGFPLDGVRTGIGADGRIRVRGPVLFSGYRLRPGESARAFAGPWFVTADLGAYGQGGRLEVRGRADDMINTGGTKVVAAEVEQALGSCPGVRDVAVIGLPDLEWGQRVTAVVVPADTAAPPELALIRSHVRDILGAHAAPRQLRLVARIPLLPSGKPDRQALRAEG
jgi:o-succinylbenzoate---CoA ligase